MLIKARCSRPRRSFALMTFIVLLALICVNGIAAQDCRAKLNRKTYRRIM